MSPSERIKEERERLGFSQTAFGALAEATKATQIRWEQGKSSPTVETLVAWGRVGLDVLYVVTGVRSASTLSREEQELLTLYQAAPLAVRLAAAAALASGVVPQQRGPLATFGGANNGQIADTVTIHGGFNPGRKK